MSGDSSFDYLSDLEPEVISRSGSVEPEGDPRGEDLPAMIETVSLENDQLKMMHQMEALRIQEQVNLEVKFKALMEEEAEKNQILHRENHHLKEQIQSMFIYCNVLDEELRKLRETVSANVLPLEELCACQKQKIAKLEQELEVASNAQKSCLEEVKRLRRWLETVVPLNLGEFNEKVKQLSIQERKATLMEQCQTSNNLASKLNGEWKYNMSQCTGTMEQKNFERQFEHSTMVYELTDTHFTVKIKRNGTCTLEKTIPLNEAVFDRQQTATTKVLDGIGIQTDICPNSEYPQGCRVIRMIVNEILGIGISSGDGTALLMFTRV